MIYLDSSVALARVFLETRSPPDAFWHQSFVSSRLMEYEVFNRFHVRAGDAAQALEARRLVDRVQLFDLAPTILARALQPFPVQVRMLDGLHLATMDFLRSHGQTIELATYDVRLAQAATALGFAAAQL